MESMYIFARKNPFLAYIRSGKTESEQSSLKEPIKFAMEWRGSKIKTKRLKLIQFDFPIK